MNQTYTVKAGDTLYGISNQFGVSVVELANLNNVDANSLRIGTVLIIPSNQGTNPDNMFLYTVKKGDTLYSIATRYNTTVQKIISLNNLKNSSLSINQVLKIPETYSNISDEVLPEFINYVVKKGDNLYSIARNNNLTVDTIIKDNNLSTKVLMIGQIIKLRLPSNIGATIEECFGDDYIPKDETKYTNYTVKKGDSLYKIANNYNTSVSAIVNLNNLKSNNLSIGQVLKIPVMSNENVYTVKSGDSLYSIARKFNTTVDNIKRKNNLKSNLLSIGQKIII